MGLNKDDTLIGTALSNGKQEILLATKLAKAFRFPEKLIRDMGRGAKGVRGIRLAEGDQVMSTLLGVIGVLGPAGRRRRCADRRVRDRGFPFLAHVIPFITGVTLLVRSTDANDRAPGSGHL